MERPHMQIVASHNHCLFMLFFFLLIIFLYLNSVKTLKQGEVNNNKYV